MKNLTGTLNENKKKPASGKVQALIDLLEKDDDRAHAAEQSTKSLSNARFFSRKRHVTAHANLVEMPDDVYHSIIFPMLESSDLATFRLLNKRSVALVKTTWRAIKFFLINLLSFPAHVIDAVPHEQLEDKWSFYIKCKIFLPFLMQAIITRVDYVKLLCVSGDITAIQLCLNRGLLARNMVPYIALSGNPEALALCAHDHRFDLHALHGESDLSTAHFCALSGNPAQLEKARELDLNLQAISKRGETVAHYCAYSGNPDQLEKAKALQLDLHTPDRYGRLIGHFCGLSGNPAQLNKAIEMGFDLHLTSKKGMTVAHFCARSGNPTQMDKAKALGLDLVARDKNGYSIVHHAAISVTPAMLEKVRELGFDLEDEDETGMRVIHLCTNSVQPRQFKKAIALGVDKDVVDNNGMGVPHYAALSKQPMQLQTVYDAGFDLDAEDNRGLTVAHYSAKTGTPAQLRKAFELGVDLDARTHDGRGVVRYCVDSGNPAQLYEAWVLGVNCRMRDNHGHSIMAHEKEVRDQVKVDWVVTLYARSLLYRFLCENPLDKNDRTPVVNKIPKETYDQAMEWLEPVVRNSF